MMGGMEPAHRTAADAALMRERTGRTLEEWVGGVALAAGLGDDCAVNARSTATHVVRPAQLASVAPGPPGTRRVGFRFRTKVQADKGPSEAHAFGQSTQWLHLASDSDENDMGSLEPLRRAAYDQGG